ncbi:dihydroxyacetone kinase transcriptional activator DhaS [Clostridium sp. CF011]|uniref:dihydroxyacetone kinase transcriptional activator DhaS n=1 Tax=unclassified Clostridium TaxID=2614128 RepID=UPI001C0C53E3|nr:MULTISPECIES: dihydroxyacetone kinase transcriptional activator DhaS [unclassified Clostridium]MBU3092116.1 dihydroxyacetone kinase transcriptional activator DhaS [Clostridium sp. CF011]MBW9146663.1 dihydroxyacetone kinase transcriptional activator DhaS [Clostridium sp. CM027]UVE42016.1 dihydroxyacetone kinase transcriptional activator DhaS [Clostridium sp. CM027]WAG71042.1 dihydroxyacetone kinase transcriptional activator DhaS [Clostridium sp. CF011]
MSESIITEKALALSLKQLMKTVPLSKISIQNIADNCRLNRQTFYYHFKDKFDLVNWIYYTEVTECIANCNRYENWTDGMYRTLCYLMNNNSFYINALNTPGQNAFNGYFFDFSCELIMGIVNDVSLGMNVPDMDKKFIADFYTHAFVGIIVQWIKTGMKDSPQIMVEKMRNVVEGSMLGALSRH